jgi:uncharacterized membrane protein
VYNDSFRMFDRPMSNIGLLPNFAHVYFQAESGKCSIISIGYRFTAMVPAFLEIMYTTVARSCPKNINMLSKKMRIAILSSLILHARLEPYLKISGTIVSRASFVVPKRAN